MAMTSVEMVGVGNSPQIIESNFQIDSIISTYQSQSIAYTIITWNATTKLTEFYIDTRWLLLTNNVGQVVNNLLAIIIQESLLKTIINSNPDQLVKKIIDNLAEIHEKYVDYRVRLLHDLAHIIMRNPDQVADLESKLKQLGENSNNTYLLANVNNSLILFAKILAKNPYTGEEVTNNHSKGSIISGSDPSPNQIFKVKLTLTKRVIQAKNWNRLQFKNKFLLNQFLKRDRPAVKSGTSSIEKIEQFKQKMQLRKKNVANSPTLETIF